MSVREIERNKRYKIEVVLGYNGDKKIRHTEVFYGGKKDAVLRENEIKSQVKSHTFVNSNKRTMKDLMNEYTEHNKNKWSPKTYISNKHWIKNITDKIGHVKLQDLNVKVLESFYNYLYDESGYSDKTIQHHYVLINGALNKAIQWNYIMYNVNSKIEKPKVRRKEIECYSPDEVNQLISVLQNESLKYQAIILLALDSGMRRGELTRINLGRYRF